MSITAVTTRQASQVRKLAIDKKVDRATFQVALDNGAFVRFLESLKASTSLASTFDLATGICRFAVDFGKTLEEMIAAGRYDWRNEDITAARFPIIGTGMVTVDAKLFHFGKDMSSDAVERELKAAGYRAATIAELLAFGATFPEVQRQFPVVALGSVGSVSGDRRVPCLRRWFVERNLDLRWRDDDWRGDYRFLAVRM